MDKKGQKRQGYLSWDEYFMGVAMLSGMRSKDPHSQVGACIVSEDNKILSMGYNGFPKGCSDDEFPWGREGDPLDTKYLYVTHSELNAILNYRGGSLEGAKLYVSLFPCNECAKAIIQAGIRTIVYDCDKYADTPSVIASKKCWMQPESGIINITGQTVRSPLKCKREQNKRKTAAWPLIHHSIRASAAVFMNG